MGGREKAAKNKRHLFVGAKGDEKKQCFSKKTLYFRVSPLDNH